ncbi:MAG: BON domain-containing protein [Legionellaceae bacterium]|nr:BON domain-containing protein [Legionellaceae bacterium]
MKQSRVCLLVMSAAMLSACIGNIWSGASLVYDRHNVYAKVNDYQLASNARNALSSDPQLKPYIHDIDITVFHGDVLLAGVIPNATLHELASRRVLQSLWKYRRYFDELRVGPHEVYAWEDHWVTLQIRGEIFSDDGFDPNSVKITTVNGTVFLMGDMPRADAASLIDIVRQIEGVQHVVNLLRYVHAVDADKDTKRE